MLFLHELFSIQPVIGMQNQILRHLLFDRNPLIHNSDGSTVFGRPVLSVSIYFLHHVDRLEIHPTH